MGSLNFVYTLKSKSRKLALVAVKQKAFIRKQHDNHIFTSFEHEKTIGIILKQHVCKLNPKLLVTETH